MDAITEHFDKLPEEKRQAVLTAGYTCFGKDGYKKTAMSEIATMAGISKAALFHYFGTKKDLFLYLYRFASDEMLAHMTDGVADFFECINIGARVKFCIAEEHPGMFDYMMKLAKETDADLLAALKEINKDELHVALDRLFARVDWTRLRPGVEPAMVMNLANWVSRGLATAPEWQGKPWQEVLAEHDRYIALIKQAVYKQSCNE